MPPLRRTPALARALLDLLFPPRCQVCRLPGEHPLCQGCRAAFEPIRPPVCARCGAPLVGPPDLRFVCLPCRRRRRPYAVARSYGVYEGRLRDAVHALKFRRRRALADSLGDLLVEVALLDAGLRGAEVIVPVPLHWLRRWTRTYNQTELLAAALGRRLGLRVETRALVRARHARAQAGLNEPARRANVRGGFAVRRAEAVRGTRVLLVDDVLTTGSTVEECARVLRRAGARSVTVLTLARTVFK